MRNPLKASHTLPVAGATAAILLAPTLFGQANQLASVNSDGEWANNRSYFSVISDDGRYVAFQSEASNLAPDDRNGVQDIFRRDTVLGMTEIVSASRFGGSANRISVSVDISANGRYVTFCTDASDVVANDSNGTWDIFVRDMDSQTTERVSVYSDGRQGNQRSDSPSMSASGRYVAFHTFEAFDPADTNPGYDVYLHDRQTGETKLVSTDRNGVAGNGDSYFADVSDDARYITFLSSATNLVTPDLNGQTDVFVKDMLTGEIVRTNVSSSGNQANDETNWPYLSGDGSVSVFSSRASNLVSGDSNNNWDLFAHFVKTGETVRISVRPDGGQANSYTRSPVGMSSDGRFVTFASLASDLVPDDNNTYQDIFVRDLVNEVNTRAVFGYQGDEIDDDCFVPFMSRDGRFITYTSEAENLTVNDGNGRRDIFMVDTGAKLAFWQDPLVRGSLTDFTVYAADPGERIYFLYSTKGIGKGPCVKQLGGLCLDLLQPITRLGQAVADGSGEATLTLRIPNNAPPILINTQAVARRGSGGADSVKSNTLTDKVE